MTADPQPPSGGEPEEKAEHELAPASASSGGGLPPVVPLPAGSVAPSQVLGAPPSGGPSNPQGRYFEVSAQFSSSPYPPPDMLQAYNHAVPGLAERLVKMIEKESEHRRSLEVKRLDAEIADMKGQREIVHRGQNCGFGIGVVAIVGGVATSIWGNPVAGGFIGTAGVVGLVSVFLARRAGSDKPESVGDQTAGR